MTNAAKSTVAVACLKFHAISFENYTILWNSFIQIYSTSNICDRQMKIINLTSTRNLTEQHSAYCHNHNYIKGCDVSTPRKSSQRQHQKISVKCTYNFNLLQTTRGQLASKTTKCSDKKIHIISYHHQ